MAAMTSSNSNDQKSIKTTWANICQIICAEFHQNRHNHFGWRAVTHRHTHKQTHINRHLLNTHSYIHPRFRLQHIQSKWLNKKGSKLSTHSHAVDHRESKRPFPRYQCHSSQLFESNHNYCNNVINLALVTFYVIQLAIRVWLT